MGRVCAVKNCSSGSAADIKRRRELNLRKPGFFQVPKSPTKRQKWIDSLSTELSDRQYVCDLHFQNNAIQDSYLTNLPSGEVNKIMKGRITRTQDSVPLIVSETRPLIIENCITQVFSNLITDDPELSNKHKQDYQQQQQQTIREEHLPQLKLTAKRKLSYPDENVSLKRQKISEHEIDYDSQINFNNDAEILSIIIELNKIFPVGWCFIPGINQLIAVQFDRVKLKERVRIIVNHDQSVLVTFLEHHEKQIDTQIKSVNDLVNCLKCMELKKLCTGTGFNTKSYSLKCRGDVSDIYKRCQAFPRCPECRKLRLKLIKLKKKDQTSNIVNKMAQVTSKSMDL